MPYLGTTKKQPTGLSFNEIMSNKYPASTTNYKSSELPWSSSLASSSKYPLSRPSATNISISSVNQTDTLTSSTSNNYLNQRQTTTTINNPRVISTTISGRSLFDYSKPKSAISNPSSMIYDGRIRRTVTAKHYRPTNKEETVSVRSTVESSAYSGDIKLKNSISTASKQDYLSSPNKFCESNQTFEHSCIAKPFRSSSLKLKASYSNILDQLTTTTLAKLKLGSSNSSHNYSRSKTSTKFKKLDVVPDEPEIEGEDEKGNGAQEYLRVRQERFRPDSPPIDKKDNVLKPLSPSSTSISSSSCLSSSSGLVCDGTSPTSSASSSQRVSSPLLTSSTNLQPPNSKNDTLKASSALNLDSGSDDFKNIDSGNSNDEKFSKENSDEDEQDNLVSPESDEGNKLSSRKNFIEARKILAELKKFDDSSQRSDDDDDDVKSDSHVPEGDKKEKSNAKPEATLQANESELVLKFKISERVKVDKTTVPGESTSVNKSTGFARINLSPLPVSRAIRKNLVLEARICSSGTIEEDIQEEENHQVKDENKDHTEEVDEGLDNSDGDDSDDSESDDNDNDEMGGSKNIIVSDQVST